MTRRPLWEALMMLKVTLLYFYSKWWVNIYVKSTFMTVLQFAKDISLLPTGCFRSVLRLCPSESSITAATESLFLCRCLGQCSHLGWWSCTLKMCVCVFSLSSTCLVNVNNSRSNFNWLIPSRSGALSTFGLQNTTGSKVTKMLLKYIVITLIFPTLKIDLTIFFTFFYQYWVSPLVPIIIF